MIHIINVSSNVITPLNKNKNRNKHEGIFRFEGKVMPKTPQSKGMYKSLKQGWGSTC